MARSSPVNSWAVRHTPKMEPRFHMKEMLLGEGSVTRLLFMIFMSVFRGSSEGPGF